MGFVQQAAKDLGIRRLEAYGDCKSTVMQVQGGARINRTVKPLLDRIRKVKVDFQVRR